MSISALLCFFGPSSQGFLLLLRDFRTGDADILYVEHVKRDAQETNKNERKLSGARFPNFVV